jgi:hypothetical protein
MPSIASVLLKLLVWPCRWKGLRLAMSNRPPMPSVELIRKRPSVFSARLGRNWTTSLRKVTGE